MSAPATVPTGLRVDLVDGTYELFRHFYAPRAPGAAPPAPGDRAAVRGVLGTVLRMLEEGATHVAVATDHVIESFRNDLWPGYKTGEGIDPALWEQFHPLEEALAALGVTVWAMVEFEADDALAAAAAVAAADPRVAQVRIWTPDKDLAQCVDGQRVVQIDRRSGAVRDEAAVIARFGVPPAAIPDWLALVGDSADGYPGIPGWGAKSAAAVLARFGRIEDIPAHAHEWPAGTRGALTLASSLASRRELALLFKRLATLRRDAPVSPDVEALRWRGPRPALRDLAERLGAAPLIARATTLAAR
ncbi:MAG TPA: 5'-3' exonuclease H3TH domain-containing protein [Thermoanaerobaculia bacterium]|jgi:5'-3' exonuclease|nr:5'-3' exonuclease H3TH domain-containing protein [Thermoanaerobaculia bacterium]